MRACLLCLLIVFSSCQSDLSSPDVLSVALAVGEHKSPFGHGFSAMSPYDSSGTDFWAKAAQPATGVPDTLLEATVYTQNMQVNQHIYYGFKAGLMDTTQYEGYKENGFINEKAYTTEFVDQEIHVVVGRLRDSSFVVIFDTDNDEDLGDEEILIAAKENPETNWFKIEQIIPSAEVQFELFDGEKIRNTSTKLAVNPYLKLPPGMPNLAFAGGQGYRTGRFEYGGEHFAWWVADPSSVGAFTNMGSRIWVESIDSDEEIGRPKEQERLLGVARSDTSADANDWPEGTFPYIEEPYEMGDLLTLGGDYFKLEEIDPTGSTLVLKRAEEDNVGLRKGLEAPDFEGLTIDNTAVRLSDFRGKYVLIDFWGTWCAPCIMEVPHLVEAYESFSRDDFEILAVANDSPDLVRDFVEKEGLEWIQVVQEESDPSRKDILELYRIRGYPTTYLVNREGVIVEREAKLRGTELKKTLSSFIEPVS